MQLKKSSWWWRYYVFLYEHFNNWKYPTEAEKYGISICRLANGIFWRTLGFLIFRILPGAFIVYSAFFSVYWLFAHGFIMPADNKSSSFTFFVLGLTVWGLLALIGIVFGLYVWNDSRVHKPTSEHSKSPEPGIILSWLRAKKQKVCPLVEIVDDEK